MPLVLYQSFKFFAAVPCISATKKQHKQDHEVSHVHLRRTMNVSEAVSTRGRTRRLLRVSVEVHWAAGKTSLITLGARDLRF